MASIREEWARLQFLMEHGRGDEKCHVVLIEEEARKRKENDGPNPKTRFQWETDTAEGYGEFNAGKDRLLRLIGNKQIAISIAAKLWTNVPEILLQALAEDRPLTLSEIIQLLDSEWLYELLPGDGKDDFILQKLRQALEAC